MKKQKQKQHISKMSENRLLSNLYVIINLMLRKCEMKSTSCTLILRSIEAVESLT
jgi:hypothetical protein